MEPKESSGFDLVVVGGANIDYLVRTQRLPQPGETLQGGPFHEGVGGKGANQAVAAARLGARVGFLAKLGRDTRAVKVIEKLSREGVSTDLLLQDHRAATGVALISVEEGGEKEITVAPGANAHLTGMDVECAREAIESAQILLVQLEVPMSTVQRAIEIAFGAGVRVILDPAPAAAIPSELFEMIDVIRPNAKEAEFFTGIEVFDRPSAFEAADVLLHRGVQAAFVQAGPEGNLLVTEDGEETWFPKFDVASVDATGAGDAFLGALAAYWLDGKTLPEAGRYASAAAALKTLAIGAQTGLARREDIEAFLASEAREAKKNGRGRTPSTRPEARHSLGVS